MNRTEKYESADHPADETPFLTEEQAAARLQISPSSLRAWRVRRTGPAYLKLGRLVRYERDEIDSWARGCQAAA